MQNRTRNHYRSPSLCKGCTFERWRKWLTWTNPTVAGKSWLKGQHRGVMVVDPQEESTTDNRTQVRVCKRYLRDNPADSSFQQIPQHQMSMSRRTQSQERYYMFKMLSGKLFALLNSTWEILDKNLIKANKFVLICKCLSLLFLCEKNCWKWFNLQSGAASLAGCWWIWGIWR